MADKIAFFPQSRTENVRTSGDTDFIVISNYGDAELDGAAGVPSHSRSCMVSMLDSWGSFGNLNALPERFLSM